MPEPLLVRLDNLASPAEVDEVREVVASSGLTAEVRADWDRSQTGNGGFWLVLLELGQQSIPGFIGGVGIWGLQALVRQLRRARRSSAAPDGWVELEESDGTAVMLVGDEAEAYEKLRDLNWVEHRRGRLMWIAAPGSGSTLPSGTAGQ